MAPVNNLKNLAIIMDGNGRWAQSKSKSRSFGHIAGAENLKNIVLSCIDLGIESLSVFAFSTENWFRPIIEVEFLMNIFAKFCNDYLGEFQIHGIKLDFIGNLAALPRSLQDILSQTKERTANNKKFRLIIAINYGGRQEIVDASKKLFQKISNGDLQIEDIDEKIFSSYMYLADMPEPDLLIRTSGELRLSNFLLWHLAYSELYICDKFWPDFNSDDLRDAVQAFEQRERRFGKIK